MSDDTSTKPKNAQADDETVYQVVVKTGDERGAGTDSTVKLVIVGDKGRSRSHVLTKWYTDTHERNTSFKIKLKDKDVGIFEYAVLDVGANSLGQNDIWYVEYVELTKESELAIKIPLHKWITEIGEVVLMTNTTCIPQKETDVRASARIPAIKDLQWSHAIVGVPGYIAAPPTNKYVHLNQNLKFTTTTGKEFKARVIKGKFDTKMENIKSLFTSLDSLEDFEKPTRFHKGERSKWVDKWQSDEEFGRQVLNGSNPGEIERCYKLPEQFPVTDDHVKGLLKRGKTLEEEMKAGFVYIIDHKLLEGIPTGIYKKKKVELAVPMCLLYVTPDEKLVPIAIQLGQEARYKFPIWTPNDATLDWLFVKMWFKNADMQIAEINTHLMHSHLFVEPFAIATQRCLSPAHPVHKLLREHIEYVCAINTFARQDLIVPGGAIDKVLSIGHGSSGTVELMHASARNLNIDDINIPKNIKKRDVADIPAYHYRDDALLVWNAVIAFVQAIIDIYYASDAEVGSDKELQDWIADIYNEGFQFVDSTDHCGIPEKIASKHELVELLTSVISAGTIGHTSANYLQYEYYHIIPNYPGTMVGPIPTEADRGAIDMARIMSTLPDESLANYQVFIMWILSQQYEEQIFIADYPRWLFSDDKSAEALENFRVNLNKVEDTISTRNQKLEIPYDVILPSKLPAGISI